jgi:predicted AAA+ superfamily ATPase
MVQRHFWLGLIEQAWRERSVLWLAGVRRVGKTVLCQSLPEIEYLDCELPSVRRRTADPEGFLKHLGNRQVVLDEVHRLPNPSELLKIAADHFPKLRLLATGSSTLGASRKFRDTLTGRKRNIWLTPMCLADLRDARLPDLPRRFLRGGLPHSLLAPEVSERDFQEWMDDYWSKDINVLFRFARHDAFIRFTELLLAQSGGIFDAQRFARACEVNRQTIQSYLRALEGTLVAQVVRPFSTRRSKEIVAAPKVYGFDTGFVACYRGWRELREEDMGVMWEHFVLNEMTAVGQTRDILYWRDKRGHEVDFVLSKRRREPVAIECKWSADGFEPRNLLAFRRQYPKGENYVVAHDVDRGFVRQYNGITVRFESLGALVSKLGF